MTNFSVKIFCGSRCNQNCEYCDIVSNSSDHDFYAFEYVEPVIEVLRNTENFFLEIEGGEVTEYPNIIQWAMKLNVPTYLFSNGTQITDELCESLNEHTVVRVSLDGPEELHNTQRGKTGFNGFQRTMQGIETLKRHNIPFIIGCTVTEKTIPYLPECRTLFEEINPQKVVLTTQMFDDDPSREKTKAIFEKAYPIIRGWFNPIFQYFSFHEEPPKDINVEILFKHDRLELHVPGFQTATFLKIPYEKFNTLWEVLKDYGISRV